MALGLAALAAATLGVGRDDSPCGIPEVAGNVMALVARISAIRGVAFHTDSSGTLPPVLADQVQLEQVLPNLVMNAIDAIAEVEPPERRVEVRATVDIGDGHRFVTVRVADRGIGLMREDVSRLCDAFSTTKPQGVGLGLAISRSIIESHGRRPWAESGLERGAVFAFCAPTTQGAAT